MRTHYSPVPEGKSIPLGRGDTRVAYVYALRDSLNGRIFYVGQSDNLPRRLKAYQSFNAHGNPRLLYRLHQCRKRGAAVEMLVLEVVTHHVLKRAIVHQRELEWVRRLDACGCPLANSMGMVNVQRKYKFI